MKQQKNKFMSFLKNSSILFLFLVFLCCKENNKNEKSKFDIPLIFEGKVTSIKDGDTYKVFYNGKEQTVRLAHIDCPEKKQPYGNKAKKFASDICFGNVVVVKSDGNTDRFKRIIAEILLKDGRNVNKELVKNGLAWHFKKYSDNIEYAELEIIARNNHFGIWSESNPIAPWDWRKKTDK
jgi:micrococcal nuclease